MKNLTDPVAPSSSSLLFSGGYNVGVRYLLNGTVLVQPNNSFAAYALARTFASEADRRTCWARRPARPSWSRRTLPAPRRTFSSCAPPDSFVLSPRFLISRRSHTVSHSSVLLTRLLTYTYPPNTTLVVGLLTNLYHMPKFWSIFLTVLQSPAFAAVKPVALFAEDFVCLRATSFSGTDWISAVTDYYAANFAASTWNATAIEQIMLTRRGGDLSVSVGSLCGAACVV